jgi:hypothetical protein
MNDELLRWLLAAHAFATLFMTGLIWFVQVVHYPLFDQVGKAEFAGYERQHTRRTGWVVGGPMLLEMALALLLAWSPGGLAAWCGLGLLGVVWLSTALGQVPAQGARQDPSRLRQPGPPWPGEPVRVRPELQDRPHHPRSCAQAWVREQRSVHAHGRPVSETFSDPCWRAVGLAW